MTFEEKTMSKKELLTFIKNCVKLGVQEFSGPNFTFKISPTAFESTQSSSAQLLPRDLKISNHTTKAADAIERQAQEHEDKMDREMELDELRIMDPAAYEEILLREQEDGHSGHDGSGHGDGDLTLDDEEGEEEKEEDSLDE